MSRIGSSPLARGTRRVRDDIHALHRFIPARAGNTPCARRDLQRRSVHPRSRGEHVPMTADDWRRVGSSPLARGTRLHLRQCYRLERFIPARAGNTYGIARGLPQAPVHPRSRGEHVAIRRMMSVHRGSSPLARGTLGTPSDIPLTRRFIPARAGNTPPGPRRSATRPVHPRSRGEHAWCDAEGLRCDGSSPLARGTRAGEALGGEPDRFIPARAGNTLETIARCGRATGSSPLARGTHETPLYYAALDRFIPARAGNTGGRQLRGRAYPVHPRSRGEHQIQADPHSRDIGSSPLARGTPFGAQHP